MFLQIVGGILGNRKDDKNFIDLSDFIDKISIDVQKEYINVNFLTPYQLKIKALLEELPLFENVYDPRSPNWSQRVDEELYMFDLLKEQFIQQVGFGVYDHLALVAENNRVWETVFRLSKGQRKGMKIEIRLGLRYPYEFPRTRSSSGEAHVTMGDKCFGELTHRWRADGKFGIAHFLVILSYYYALEHTAVEIE